MAWLARIFFWLASIVFWLASTRSSFRWLARMLAWFVLIDLLIRNHLGLVLQDLRLIGKHLFFAHRFPLSRRPELQHGDRRLKWADCSDLAYLAGLQVGPYCSTGRTCSAALA